VAVPNLSNLRLHTPVEAEAEAVEVDSAVALNVVAADSVEEVVVSVEAVEEEEDLATEAALVTEVVSVIAAVEAAFEAVAVASEATGETTLERREVEGATEAVVVVWDTKVEDSMMGRLRAGMEVPLDRAVGPVDQVGTVLLVGVQVLALLEAVLLVVTAATEDISSERAQEGLMTETLSGRDFRCLAIALHQVLL